MKFNFISICTYLCGVCPICCSCSNYFGPNEFGYHVVLEFVLGTLEMHWKLVSFSREVSSFFWLLEPSLDDRELLSPTSTNAIPVTSIYLMHTFLAFNLVQVVSWHESHLLQFIWFCSCLIKNTFIANMSMPG